MSNASLFLSKQGYAQRGGRPFGVPLLYAGLCVAHLPASGFSYLIPVCLQGIELLGLVTIIFGVKTEEIAAAG
jgi:hypothetical protein